MRRAVVVLGAAGLLLGGGAAGADTALVHVTPRNIEGGTFTLSSKAAGRRVEFVIRRDVVKVDGPGRSAYLSHPGKDAKGLGRPVRLEEDGKVWTFRFSVPADEVAESVFTLWGQGRGGEGVTYRFNLGDFHPRRPAPATPAADCRGRRYEGATSRRPAASRTRACRSRPPSAT